MRRKLNTAVLCVSVIVLAAVFFSGVVMAQEPVKQLPVKPQLQKPVKTQQPAAQTAPLKQRTAPPDLASLNPYLSVIHTNSSSGPFAGDCLCCYKQGYMMMTSIAGYVRNVGKGPAGPSKARLTWVNGREPFDRQERILDIPALDPQTEFFINVNFDSEQCFKVDEPVAVEFDCQKQVSESNENNNVLEFRFADFLAKYPYMFNSCQ